MTHPAFERKTPALRHFIKTLPFALLTAGMNLASAFAEEAIPLADILKPSGEGASTGGGDVNMSMILFNTLLVLGVGLWVMRQIWFVDWAERVKVAHLEEGKPILIAMWQAMRLSWGRILTTPARQALTPLAKPTMPSASAMPSWLERLDVQTLETGTKLHWLRVHGQDYILTETANHSQWMKLGEDGDLQEAIPAVEGLASVATSDASPVYQLPHYLDTV
ncbi:MAG: hypothetical protein LW809_01290 [Vampirovibrionales bacterium]|jgi:hypothetical protein|nr:hypothetical protein [Vampirovibrionales bacterium]